MMNRSNKEGVVTISLREITMETGISVESVRRSIVRLVAGGAIERLKHSRHTAHAHRYRILNRADTSIRPSFLWSSKGLGQTARIIHAELKPDSWKTTKQIAEGTNCSEATVRKALLHLHSAGLISGRNPRNDRSLRKTHWQRLDDANYLTRYETWLTRKAAEETRRKMRRQQMEWKSRELNRVRETLRPEWDKRNDV
jgi:DNA-binding GntR family transcriptional regulator